METGGETKLVARLPNGPAAIEQSRLAVIRFLEPFGIFGRTINQVEVVLEELIGNLVRYGKSVNQLTVAAGYRGGVIDLIIEDDGVEFDPLAVPEPPSYTSLAEAPLGGLGIPLVRRLTSSARYDRIGSGSKARNRVSVRIKNG
jgi:anti-sigma regulatory factor (Ser/Thr protein kinase)